MSNLAITWAEGGVLRGAGLKLWASSLRKVAPRETKIVLLAPEPVQIEGVETVICNGPNPHNHPWGRRWRALARYIAEHGTDASQIMITDARDVVFQSDPFVIADGRFFAASEHFPVKDHSWCVGRWTEVFKALGKAVPPLTMTSINGGFFLAPPALMATFCSAIDSILITGAPKITGFQDQALIGWWLMNCCPFQWVFAPDYFYIHGEAVRMNKQKVTFKDGLAYSDDATLPAAIYHQYDRAGHKTRYFQKMGDIEVLLLVNHFQEDLRWLNRYEQDTFIITKSNAQITSIQSASVQLPNVGYENQSWAWFFDNYYDDLPELIVCLQDNPFEHCPEAKMKDIIAKMIAAKWAYAPICGDGNTTWTWIDNVTHHPGLPLLDWWKRLFKSPPPGYFQVWYNSQFIVHRDTVRSRPRAFWKKLSEDIKTRNDACSVERLWQFIFMGTP
jgi:hypothetical protein